MKNLNDVVNICIASDNNYAPLIATTIASVCFNTNRQVKFWCLESNINNFNKKLIDSMHDNFKNFEIQYITIKRSLIDEFASKVSTSGHISPDTYSRLFIPSLFPTMEKMLYIDIDLIAMGDIGTLYDTDLGNHLFGAIPEGNHAFLPQTLMADLQISPSHKYFNAGVLLMNPKKMFEANFLTDISNIANNYAGAIRYGDQDLLNKYGDGAYLELPWRFNILGVLLERAFNSDDATTRQKIHEEYNNIVIRHFESECKPWLTDTFWLNNAKIKNSMEFWTIAAMTPYLAWFERQFKIKEPDTNEIFDGDLRVRLFGILPLIRIKNRAKKKTYLVFNCIPLITCKLKNNNKKKVWRLFDCITILTQRY